MPVLHLIDQEKATGRTRRGRRVPVLWPWLLVAVAWAVLVLAMLTHQTFLLDHHYLLQASGLPWLAALEIFLLCWQVMTVAMMLPSSMPMVKLVVYAGRRQARPVAVPLAFLAGYGVIWTAFAAGAFLGDTLVHRLVDLWPWLDERPWLIGAVTFFVAGLFQFSPLKERCLGCCWALMLVMFGVGVGNLAGMAALTGAMVIEKAVPGGKRLSPLVGIALLLLGMVWLAHPLWLHRAG